MLPLAVILLVVLPIIELTLLFKLGNWLGWIPTLALVLGAGLVGAAVARHEGLRAAARLRQQMVQGVLPAAELFDGMLVAVAGVLLVLPGLLSDVLGLLLLVPVTRKFVRQWLMQWARSRFRVEGIRDSATTTDESRVRGDKIIDARVIETRVID